MSVGSHSITAIFSGDGNFNGSSSTPLTETVNAALPATATTLVSSVNPSALKQSVTFTATVTSTAGIPTGVVTFKDSGTTLGTGSLNSSGQTAFATSKLSMGFHSITAVYGGDNNSSSSTSPVLTQTVKHK